MNDYWNREQFNMIGAHKMGDFLFDWNESHKMESLVSGGMPIPRGRGGSELPDLSTISLDLHEHSPFKSGLQGNSLGPQWDVGNAPLLQDNIGLSPLTPNSPSLWPAQNMDMDMDIKLEPLDDLLGVDDLIQGPGLTELNASDENLLDNVNFDDLLNSESAGIHNSSTTTSLDHQHHSPAAMATVRPDEVMGIRRRHENSSSSLFNEIVGNENSNSSNGIGVVQQPIKEESPSLYSLLASSFPPQGGGWRDPLLTSSSLPGPSFAGRLASIEERPNSSTPQHIPFHQNQHHPQQELHQQQLLQQNNSGSTSALEELLLRSSSTPVSTTPLSPHSVASPHEATSPLDTSSQQDTSNMDNSPATPLGISVPRPSSLSSANPLLSARLSSSAPVHNFSLEQAWQRREPRQHLLSTGSLAEEFGGSASSLSTVGGILSPGAHDLSIDEGIDSDDDSDNEHYDTDSDNDSNVSEETSSLSSSYGKKERYFWQYNVQAKGPKGQKVAITHKEKDPHRLTEIMDPVFSPMCSLQGVKHRFISSGKARRGDGNDLTPNPKKLVNIGRELDKLNKVINDMTPVSELPFNIRPKSRKEKNKLASRACRLKKKAQHEANKIKLYGLEAEHAKLMNLIADVKQLLLSKVEAQVTPLQQQELTNHIEKSCKQKSKFRIAGHTTEFVNKVIDSSRNPKMTNSLDEILNNFSANRLSSSPVSNMNINNNSNMSDDVQMM